MILWSFDEKRQLHSCLFFVIWNSIINWIVFFLFSFINVLYLIRIHFVLIVQLQTCSNQNCSFFSFKTELVTKFFVQENPNRALKVTIKSFSFPSQMNQIVVVRPFLFFLLLLLFFLLLFCSIFCLVRSLVYDIPNKEKYDLNHLDLINFQSI